MHLKRNVWAVIIMVGLGLIMTTHVQAGTSDNIFSDWQGKFISREFVNVAPEMDAVYEKVAVEAKKMGKNYTVAQIRHFFKKMIHTDCQSISLKGDTIVFYAPNKNAVTHQYKSTGTIADTYKDYKFEWYAFEAVDKAAVFSAYRYIIMLKIHQHENSQPHFHFRYGNKGGNALTQGTDTKNWWPTMVKPDFDLASYIKSINPKIMAKVLP